MRKLDARARTAFACEFRGTPGGGGRCLRMCPTLSFCFRGEAGFRYFIALGSIGNKGDCVDFDERALEQASDLHSRARRQIFPEALAAHAVVFAVLVEARQPRRNANDI